MNQTLSRLSFEDIPPMNRNRTSNGAYFLMSDMNESAFFILRARLVDPSDAKGYSCNVSFMNMSAPIRKASCRQSSAVSYNSGSGTERSPNWISNVSSTKASGSNGTEVRVNAKSTAREKRVRHVNTAINFVSTLQDIIKALRRSGSESAACIEGRCNLVN